MEAEAEWTLINSQWRRVVAGQTRLSPRGTKHVAAGTAGRALQRPLYIEHRK